MRRLSFSRNSTSVYSRDGGGWGLVGEGAGVSEFVYYESKFKIKKIFFGGGRGWGIKVSDFFSRRIQI